MTAAAGTSLTWGISNFQHRAAAQLIGCRGRYQFPALKALLAAFFHVFHGFERGKHNKTKKLENPNVQH